MNEPNSVHEYIQSQETAYTQPINVIKNYFWSMKDHIELSTLYLASQLSTGKDDYKPVRNIVRPILNLQHRATGFDVKDMEIYVDNPDIYFKSFMVKKYHDVWARQEGIDTFIDELVESYCDFGGVLVKKVKGARPEVVPMASIAFCDQTDILSGPIAIKHFFSPDELRAMAKNGWGEENNGANMTVEGLITLAKAEKVPDAERSQQNKTPGKYIEVYEIHGELPAHYLPNSTEEGGVRQFRIDAFYQTSNGKKGVTLFAVEEKESPFKFLARDPIFGRALGMGGVEELFEAQAWTNYDMIRMQDMLDAASKTIMRTTDPTLSQKHPKGMKDMENMEFLELQQGTEAGVLDTFPRNLDLFMRSMEMWEAHGQQMGAANETIMGESPPAGTPFKLQALVAAEAHSLHEYRKGQIATFVGEIYDDWILLQISKEIIKERTFMADFSLDEIQLIAQMASDTATNRWVIEQVLSGKVVFPFEVQAFKQDFFQQFIKKGNKRFLKIIKNEFKEAPLRVKINIAGKQKNLALMTDKMVNIFRFIFSNPQGFVQLMQIPGMAKSFNRILEFSGLSPVDFNGLAGQFGVPQGNAKTPPQLDLGKKEEVAPGVNL